MMGTIAFLSQNGVIVKRKIDEPCSVFLAKCREIEYVIKRHQIGIETLIRSEKVYDLTVELSRATSLSFNKKHDIFNPFKFLEGKKRGK